jgi:hypothetical protein
MTKKKVARKEMHLNWRKRERELPEWNVLKEFETNKSWKRVEIAEKT